METTIPATPIKPNESNEVTSPKLTPAKKSTPISASKATTSKKSTKKKSTAKNGTATSLKSPSPSKGKTAEKKKSTPATVTKKRKIEEIEKNISDISNNIERLKKNKKKLEKTISDNHKKLQEENAVKTKLAIATSLHAPSFSYKIDQDSFFDLLSCWQYLYIFRNKLSLPILTIESFIDLMIFTTRDSVGLVEIFTTILKCLLNDKKTVKRIIRSIPKQLNIEHKNALSTHMKIQKSSNDINNNDNMDIDKKSSNFIDMTTPIATTTTTATDNTYINSTLIHETTRNDITILSNLIQWCHISHADATFDTTYNGLHLMPRYINSTMINGLSWQAILRCILLRLEPVKQMRKQFTIRTSEIQVIPSTIIDKNITEQSCIMNVEESTIKNTNIKNSFLDDLNDAPTSTPLTTLRLPNSLKRNTDALLSMTSDATSRLYYLYQASEALQTEEVYSLPYQYKIAILLTLIEACHSTQEFIELMESNAEELSTKITEMNKQNKENKLTQKSAMESRKKEAITLCKQFDLVSLPDGTAISITSGNGGNGTIQKKKGPPKKKGIMDIKSVKNKELLEPSFTQLNTMIEDLIMLSTYGIDSIQEMPILTPPEYNLEDDDDLEGGGGGGGSGNRSDENKDSSDWNIPMTSTRSKKSSYQKDRKYEIQRAWNEYEESRLRYEEAFEYIETLKKNGGYNNATEKELKIAIKKGSRGGLKWTDENKKTYCTMMMKEIYKALYQLETKAKEDRETASLEKALLQYCIRIEPLGRDTQGNSYWMFPGCDDVLFIEYLIKNEDDGSQQRTSLSSVSPPYSMTIDPILNAVSVPTLNILNQDCALKPLKIPQELINSINSVSTIFQDNPAIKLLYNSCTASKPCIWAAYTTATSLWYLCENLDGHNELEKNLKAAIIARYNVVEPVSTYLTEGSEYIGRKVMRTFNKKSVIGTVVGWLPQEGDDPALWHIQHIDGDEEDLELHEIQSCLISIPTSSAISSQTSSQMPSRNQSSSNLIEDKEIKNDLSKMEMNIIEMDGNNEKYDAHNTKEIQVNESKIESKTKEFVTSETVDGVKTTTTNIAPINIGTKIEKDDKEVIDLDEEVEFDEHDDQFQAENKQISNHTDKTNNGNKSAGSHNTSSSNSNSSSSSSEEAVEDIEPAIIRKFPLFRRNYNQIKETSISLAGLQQELLSTQRQVHDALKRLGSEYTKTNKKLWEENVRNAFSLDELKSSLLVLETYVHDLQEVDDVIDEEIWEKHRLQKIKSMKKEGWIFDNTTDITIVPTTTTTMTTTATGLSASASSSALSMKEDPMDVTDPLAENVTTNTSMYYNGNPLSAIGKRVRRFFHGYGHSDGTILAYLPSQQNEGLALWHMEHDDGDEEDLEEKDIEKVIRHYTINALEDDPIVTDDMDITTTTTSGGGGGTNTIGNKGNSSSATSNAAYMSEDDSDDDDYEQYNHDDLNTKNKHHTHLWPTIGVRKKWMHCIERSHTVGEVALGLMTFIRYATRFGVVESTQINNEFFIGERTRRGRTELDNLLKGSSMTVYSEGGTRSSDRNRKEARRKSYFYE